MRFEDPQVARSSRLRPWYDRLRVFEDFAIEIAIHGDPAWMPRSRADWADLHHVLEPAARG